MDPQSARQLWRRVLLQVIRDAIGTARIKDMSPKTARRDARLWLEGRSRDFTMVCTLAGYEPDMIRDWWMGIKDNPREAEAAARRMRDVNNGAEARRVARNLEE